MSNFRVHLFEDRDANREAMAKLEAAVRVA
jgi:hypothetical protein